MIGTVFTAAIFVTAETTGERVLLAVLSIVLVAFAAVGFRLSRQPSVRFLTLTDDGIQHPKLGLIRWEEIRDVEVRRTFGTRGVAIWMRDPDVIPKRLSSPWLRAIARLNNLMGWPPIMLTENVVDVPAFYDQIRSRREA